MLVRKLTSETLTSDKSLTLDIIKKYFGKNTELAKELQLYNNLIKEQYKSEAYALEFIREITEARRKLNQSVLKRQRYNLVKEISKNFVFENISKTRINNYKVLASIYMLFEHSESSNPKQIMDCKTMIVEHGMPTIKNNLKEHAITVTDKATKIKIEKLSEMLCSVENKKVIKESHVLSLLRYMDLVNELKQVHS